MQQQSQPPAGEPIWHGCWSVPYVNFLGLLVSQIVTSLVACDDTELFFCCSCGLEKSNNTGPTGSNQGVFGAAFLLGALDDNPFPGLSQLLEAPAPFGGGLFLWL